MSDREDVQIMLARAANITERTLDRFASDHWGPTETDYARKLIADLAAVAGSATQSQPLTPRTLEAAINCVDACAADEREPERYREWYEQAATELRAVAGSATEDTSEPLEAWSAYQFKQRRAAGSATPSGDDVEVVTDYWGTEHRIPAPGSATPNKEDK